MYLYRTRLPIIIISTSTRTMTTIADVQRINSKTLSERILAERELPDQTYAIIDVRDDDYIGGHIKGSINIPSRQLDAMMPSLARRLEDKQAVVFHCALSQQRGPAAALRYLREKGAGKPKKEQEGEENGQVVYVLDKGFEGWQEVFGKDEKLTEGYRPELWVEYGKN